MPPHRTTLSPTSRPAPETASPGADARLPRPAPPAPARERLLSGRFLRVTAGNFFFFMTFASFFLLPLRVRELGGDERMVGFVMGTNGGTALIGVIVVGLMIDRLGARRFLRGGMAVMALSSISFAFVDRLGFWIFFLRAVQGFAFAAGFNASSTFAAAIAPRDRRAAALGLFGVSTLVTHALAPTLGEQVVALAGFPTLFAIAGSFSIVGLAIAWTLPDVAHVPPAEGAPAPPGFPTPLLATFATSTCCGIAFGTVLSFVPTFVLDENLGPVATFFLSYTGAAILTRLWAGPLADDYGLRRMILPGIALLACAILGLATVHSTIGLACAGAFFGLAQGIVYPTLNAFGVDLAVEGQLGRVQAFYNGSFNVGVTSGALALGPVVHTWGHRTAFVCAAGMAFVAFTIFAVGSRPSVAGRSRG